MTRLNIRSAGLAAIILSTVHAWALAAPMLPPVAGLQLHLDASDTSTVLDFQDDKPGDVGFTGNVKKWLDKSSNAYVADAGGAHAATFETDGLGGSTPVLRFTGNNSRRMTIPGFNHGGDETIFAVFSASNISSGQILNSNGTAGGGGNYMLEFTGSKAQGRLYSGGVSHGTVNGAVAAGTPYVASYLVDDGATKGASLFLDGTQQGTANTNAIATATVSASLGNHPTGAAAYSGDLAELIVYDHALSVGEQKQVGLYLEEKYRIPTSYSQYGEGSEVSVNFSRSSSTVWTVLDPTEWAGVVSVPNWNDVDIDASRSFGPIALNDADGQPTALTIRSTVSPGYDSNNGAGNATPDHKMMNGSLYFDNGDGSDTGWITLEGVRDTFPNTEFLAYDVYVYFESDASNRDMTFTINGQSISGLDGDTFSGTFVEAQGSGILANYAVFRGLTAASLRIDATSTNGRAGIAGIQIVGVALPEPSTFILAVLGMLGTVALRWRKRK